MPYTVIWAPAARKFIKSLPRSQRLAIGWAIWQIQHPIDPADKPDVKKLRGIDAYRLRVGDYRVIYTIDHGKIIITVVKVGHRRDVYQDRG